MDERAISPIVGVALMVVITLLLASMFAVSALNLADFGTEREAVADLTDKNEGADAGGTESHAGELIWPVDDGSGATTTHVVNYTIASDSDTAGNSLNSVTIEYADGSVDVSDVDERSDVTLVGIDGDRDGSVEDDATSDVECCPPGDGVIVADGGNTLRIELTGNYNLAAGDALRVKYTAVTNPSAGNHSATVTVNGEVDDTGTVEVES
ncbi:flagellin N-terminal-like domain-containing protein [Haloplanus vescus]|uniref:Flagellin N-terminal-like domain-containing protein n=1 Tax=Haloplanus vescus TaxID=555874 RepID=A0A1H3WUZ9_9EURY|nr:type IV pilin N-terminal domain-containing protein [Haloplanus vescus]SDZ90194.1 flagellin N-terminal-like domain-containing protein [Haloplanus vescus]